MTHHVPSPEAARRLQRLSLTGQVIAGGAIAAVLVYSAYLAVTPAELRAVMNAGVPGSPNTPAAPAFILSAVLSAIPAGIFIALMWQVRKLFQRTGKGVILDGGFARIMRRLGWLAVASGLAGIVVRSLVSMLMTMDNPPGQKMLIIEISSAQVAALIMGVLFFMFTHVFAEVARIEEDNRSII